MGVIANVQGIVIVNRSLDWTLIHIQNLVQHLRGMHIVYRVFIHVSVDF